MNRKAKHSITLLQIETFLTVARHGKLTIAAAEMNITQPTLSKELSMLESAIGIKLFERSSKGVVLTSEGEYLQVAFDRLCRNIDKILENAQTVSEGKNMLQLAVPHDFEYSINYSKVSRLINEYQKANPIITIEKKYYDDRDLFHSIIMEDADVAIAQDYTFPVTLEVYKKKVSNVSLNIVIASNHMLAKSEHLEYDKLEIENLFCIDNDNCAYTEELMKEICRDSGFQPNRIVFVQNLNTLMHNVKEERGFGIVGKQRNYNEKYGVKYYPLLLPVKNQHVVAVCLDEKKSLQLQSFIDYI